MPHRSFLCEKCLSKIHHIIFFAICHKIYHMYFRRAHPKMEQKAFSRQKAENECTHKYKVIKPFRKNTLLCTISIYVKGRKNRKRLSYFSLFFHCIENRMESPAPLTIGNLKREISKAVVLSPYYVLPNKLQHMKKYR